MVMTVGAVTEGPDRDSPICPPAPMANRMEKAMTTMVMAEGMIPRNKKPRATAIRPVESAETRKSAGSMAVLQMAIGRDAPRRTPV